MDLSLLTRKSDVEWWIEPHGRMGVPGIVYATGVAAFDADRGGIASAGGVRFDISWGVRLLTTGLTRQDVEPLKKQIADDLSGSVPAGVGSVGRLHLDVGEMDAMLAGGARWAVDRGYGIVADLERIEAHGCMTGAKPEEVSEHAKKRQCDEMGALGSGNHYLEVQQVVKVFESAGRWARR
jgi:tRNA-splicing ligase RtcB